MDKVFEVAAGLLECGIDDKNEAQGEKVDALYSHEVGYYRHGMYL